LPKRAASGRDGSPALSGPNLATEVARGLPASAVVAGRRSVAGGPRLSRRLGRREFRLYVNSDILGVELGGALKEHRRDRRRWSADGLGFGDNGKAGLITQRAWRR